MLFSCIFTVAVLLAGETYGAYKFSSTAGTNALQAKGLRNLKEYLEKHPNKECSFENAAVRREWSDLSPKERSDYNKAVLCLQSKPAISGKLVPGARSRYDDFAGTHINQTLHIHVTGNFLSWHRYFIHTYEKALREECGYQGYLPYWGWPKYTQDLLNSPLFDGSETSLGGNGKFRKHPGFNITSLPKGFCKGCTGKPVERYAAHGGGCVEEGPYKDLVVNLGPVLPVLPYVKPNPRKSGLGYNPRCMRRDISNLVSQRDLSDNNVTRLITESDTINDFQLTLQRTWPKQQRFALHTAGHASVAGDPGGDLFASPLDPYFYLHHAMVDRAWWIWQSQDVGNRYYVISGTRTIANQPPSPNATLHDLMNLGVNAGDIPLRRAMSTTKDMFCYVYN